MATERRMPGTPLRGRAQRIVEGEDEVSSSVDESVGAESEADISPSSVASLRQAVVTGTDWTTATILDQLRRGNIDLNPRFQRREVWQPAKKSQYIESLLLGIPVPQIVLAELQGRRGRYMVLDGKQRLLTLRQFCSDPDTHPEDAPFSHLYLKNLKYRSELDGLTYKNLQNQPGLADDYDAFDNSTIRTVIVRNWPSDDYLFLVFLRLNTNSVPLSPQELRQALKPGGFTDYVDERSVDSEPLRDALNQSGPDFRMRDTEILLRALAFALRPNEYTGNLKQFLDSTCEIYNQLWPDVAAEVSATTDAIEGAIQQVIDIFGERIAFSRFTEGLPERRFNRAVFDVMVSSLMQEDASAAARDNPAAVVETLKALCAGDPRFVSAISSTTKSLQATAYRFVTWADSLGEALGVEVSAPDRFRDRVAQ